MKTLKQLALENLSTTETTYEDEANTILLAIIDSVNLDIDVPNYRMMNDQTDFRMENGKIQKVEFMTEGDKDRKYINGKLVQVVEWYPHVTGKQQMKYEKWIKNDILHRTNGPALQIWNEDGQIIYEIWSKNGKWHRKDGPAQTEWYDNGNKKSEKWYKKGVMHRENGSAFQEWYQNNQPMREEWLKNGEWYREDGPAVQFWYLNGQKQFEQWLINNELHRVNGPSSRTWEQNGQLRAEEWYENGIKIK